MKGFQLILVLMRHLEGSIWQVNIVAGLTP